MRNPGYGRADTIVIAGVGLYLVTSHSSDHATNQIEQTETKKLTQGQRQKIPLSQNRWHRPRASGFGGAINSPQIY